MPRIDQVPERPARGIWRIGHAWHPGYADWRLGRPAAGGLLHRLPSSAQTTACVFQAADCQASPSGLWGPDGATLEKDAKAIAKARRSADASISRILRFIQDRDKASSATWTREQTDFASQRDEVCRDYAAEGRHGFCEDRMTEARAALLRKRAEDLQHKGAETSN